MNLDERLDRMIREEGGTGKPACNWCWVCPDCHTAVVEGLVAHGATRIGAGPELSAHTGHLHTYIDHTLLKADATRAQVEALCDEARQYHFASVCVNSTWVAECAARLRGSQVPVCTVVGFPLGAMSAAAKAYETEQALRDGAGEIDMVINLGRLKSGEYSRVHDDIAGVVAAAAGVRVKVIIETCYLTDEEKIKACILSMEARAHFVKTSTGFGTGGATPGDVALMRRVVGPTMGVKASGGIRSNEDAQLMIAAGATRLGASASIAIVQGGSDKETRY